MKVRYDKKHTNIVRIHNNLVEARYKFSREQQLILLQVGKTLQQMDVLDKKEDTDVTYQAGELLTMLNISDKRVLRGVINSLQRCIMTFKNVDERWECDVNIFIKSKYHTGGKIEIKLDYDMLPFFKHLTHELGNYTELNIAEMKQFKSQYTIRLYQLARKFQNIGVKKGTETWKQEKIYTLEEFQKLMGSEYDTWQKVSTKVIKPALAELKDNSYIYVDVEPIKGYKKGQTRGRMGVVAVKLKVNRVNHYQAKLL